MEYYVKSKAFQSRLIDGNYEVTNYISGKCFKIDSLIMELWNKCSSKKTLSDISSMLLNDNFSKLQIEKLIDFLLTNKLLVTNEKDVICETVKCATPAFAVDSVALKSIKRRSIVFIGTPFGQGNDIDSGSKIFPLTFRNTTNQYFPFKNNGKSIRSECIHNTFNICNLQNLIKQQQISDFGDIFYCTGTDASSYYNNISQIISQVSETDNIPFVLGGDHSITYPIIKGIANHHKDFIILHFDAHADYKNSSLVSLYDNIGLGLLNHATVMNYCEKVENVSEIIQCGVREPFIYETEKIKSVSLYDIRKKTEVYSYLKEKECAVYISFDIDYFDPAIAPGTASTIINGGLYDETFNFLSEILRNKEIIGVDIVEVNPNLDIRNTTMNLAINLILQILSCIKIETK